MKLLKTAAIIVAFLLMYVLTSAFAKPLNLLERKSIEVSEEVLFQQELKNLYYTVDAKYYDLSFQAFSYAMTGYHYMKKKNRLSNDKYISIIDFTKNSSKKRFYTIDLEKKQVIYYTYVAHGTKTGLLKSTDFSDKFESHQSSIGFYITGKTYVGSKGFSLRLYGDEAGYNKNMYNRAIVMHTANYVSQDYIYKHGRLGRSWGCPVLPSDVYKQVINTIKEGSLIFAYYDDKNYLTTSKYLKIKNLFQA